MDIAAIQASMKRSLCEQVELEQAGINRVRIHTPFCFDDGDSFQISLKNEGGKWELSDDGVTLMRLTYSQEWEAINRGTRRGIIDAVLGSFMVEEREGSLRLQVKEEDLGPALFSFVQAIQKISDVEFLNQERVKSTFLQDVEEFIASVVGPRVTRKWHEPVRDPDKHYPVDFHIAAVKPVFIFALSNDDKARDATISLLQFEKWGLDFIAAGVYDNQEHINRKVVARFSDVCDKQFSAFRGNEERLEKFLKTVAG